MTTTGLTIIIAVLLVALLMRPNQIVVVHDREERSGSSSFILFVCVALFFLWLFFDKNDLTIVKKEGETEVKQDEPPASHQTLLPEEKEETISPEKWEVSNSDLLVYAEAQHQQVANSSGKEYYTETNINQHPPTWQWVIVVKRFAYKDQASRLQKHFSQWEMEVFTVGENPYEFWNCVPVKDETEGYEKIERWQRHQEDFAHMDLALEVIQLQME